MSNMVDKSCESVEWWTPERVLSPVKLYFDGIRLDPATAPSNPTNADRFLTREEDGLRHEWEDGTFVNPPYGPEIKEWIAKIRDQSLIGHEIIALLPASRWEQQYFQDCVFNEGLSGFCLIRKRLQFIDGNKDEVCKSNPYASLLYGFNISRWSRFEEVMNYVGTVVQVESIRGHKE